MVGESTKYDLRLWKERADNGKLEGLLTFMTLDNHFWRLARLCCVCARSSLFEGRVYLSRG